MGKTFNTGRLGNGLFVDANGNVGIGTTVPDNTYQGLTIYGSNPSVRLKGTSTGSWNWIEFVTSAGVNNFSMGVSQSTPLFAIKAGAGLDNPNFVMTSTGGIGIGTTDPQSILNGFSSGSRGVAVSTVYPILALSNTNDTSYKFYLAQSTGGAYLWTSANLPMVFGTNNVERMRVTAGGQLVFKGTSTTSNYEMSIENDDTSVYFYPSQTSGIPKSIRFFTRGSSSYEAMRITSGGNVLINSTSDMGTKLQVSGANYIEMATFAATSASASAIVSNNAGYVQFSNATARHLSNAGVLTAATDGIQIMKAGIVYVTVSQDITTAGSSSYVSFFIRKNGSNISENLITNTGGQWDGINACATIDVAAGDVIGFYVNANDITSFDPGTWSQYSFLWAAR